MAIKIGNPGMSELAAAIGQRGIEVGCLKSKVLEGQKALILNPSNENAFNSLNEIFSLIKEQKKECQTIRWQISTLQNAFRPFFSRQFNLIKGALNYSNEIALELVQTVFDAQCQSIETRLKVTIEKLNVFRKSPTAEQFDEMEKAILSLFSRIGKIEKFGSQCVAFSDAAQEKVDALKETSVCLADAIDFQKLGQFSYLFTFLNACESSDQMDRALLEQLDEKVDSMPREFVSELDEMLCDHANKAKSRSDNWSKSRRYEDIKFFKHALTTVISQGYEKRMLKTVSKDELDGIYRTVFIRAFGPAGEDYKNWVKSTFPSLIHFIEGAYHEYTLNRIGALDQNRSFSSRSRCSENKSNGEETPSRLRDFMFVNRPMTKENIIRHAHTQENEKNRSLYSLLDKIHLIEEISKRRFTSINQLAIRRAIIETLPGDLCLSLFGMISFISPAQRLGPGWGARQCSTEIPRLRRAIYNLLY